MRFDYQMYLRSDFYKPSTLLLLSVGFIIKCIIGIIRDFGDGVDYQIAGICVGLAFAFMFTIMAARGFPLLKDKSLACDVVQGKVQCIEDITFSTRHNVFNEVRTSIYIYVNGDKYYSAAMPEINAGNEVTLLVLKNSRFVIEYERDD